MTTVNIEEAQSDLTRLIDQALAGEPFLIAREGKAVVKVEAVPNSVPDEPKPRRKLGFLEGQFTIPDDFDTFMQDEIIEMFEGRPDKFADIEAFSADEKKR